MGAPSDDGTEDGAGTRPAPTNTQITSLGDVVGAFKSITTGRYIDGVKHESWTPFPKRLWQRNYWERVIRNNDELDRIRQYIAANLMRWFWDRYHVA